MLSQFLLALKWIPLLTAGSPIISLDYGTFQGATDGNLTKFLGIPFARPTARFDLPQPPLPLRGLQNATVFGPACPQQALSPLPISFPNNDGLISEACLTLDVFLPTTAQPHSKLPVLVWIYGGGFEVGNSANTDMRPTVERSIVLGEPVIIVALNYRVSAFGFLAGKEVSEEGITNLGLRDQIFGLEWVQKHVAAFGGDPERVVVGGQSAGAISTGLLLLSNKRNSSHLFRGAFMASGSPGAAPTVADGQIQYDGLVEANNCTTAPNTLDCLRSVPFDDFMATVNKTADLFSYQSLSLLWRPRLDGDVIVRNPPESVAQGQFARIPILSGDCDDEGTLFALTSLNVTTDPAFVDYVQSIYIPGATPAEVTKIAALYPQDPALGSPFDTGSANQLTPEFKRIAAFEGDIFFTGLRRFFLQHASKTQNTWSWLSKRGKSTPDLGSLHSSDLALFFPTNTTDTVAVDSLINFLNTLDPNVSAAPEAFKSRFNSTVFWPKWQTPSAEGSTSLLTFSDPDVVNVTADNFRADGIAFLNSLHLKGVTAIGL
ncbi:carotenoid ester lipase precursor [Mycena albidolilacea]|uniref:Carboxylic ester hydrolase n=1 Tax=Mycena albidolilacea TaxID=1033008 RepID=A0AAD6ZUH2_9AGAR|nr:carotenoid ester lipase precursor [Mycena albidolilacea]